MAKKKGNVYGQVVVYEKTYKGTSIGRRPNTSSMNKNKRRLGGAKKYRGQGRWLSDLHFIPMESLYLIKCLKIIDHQQVEVAVEIVGCSHKSIISVVYIELKVSEILMFVINGDQEE